MVRLLFSLFSTLLKIILDGAGVNSPRMAENGGDLPSARLVSQALTEFSHRSTQSDIWTLMLMQWGQFIDHDLTHSPIVRGTFEFNIRKQRKERR